MAKILVVEDDRAINGLVCSCLFLDHQRYHDAEDGRV